MTMIAPAAQTERRREKARTRRWGNGQTATEFALIALTLMTVLFGILVFGLAVYDYNLVSDAARDGVRYAIVHGACPQWGAAACASTNPPATDTDIQNYVAANAPGLNTSDLSVSTTWTPDNNVGSVVKVKVTYNFQPLFPMSNTTLALSSSSQMVISY